MTCLVQWGLFAAAAALLLGALVCIVVIRRGLRVSPAYKEELSAKEQLERLSAVLAAVAGGDIDAGTTLVGTGPHGDSMAEIAATLQEWLPFVPQVGLIDNEMWEEAAADPDACAGMPDGFVLPMSCHSHPAADRQDRQSPKSEDGPVANSPGQCSSGMLSSDAGSRRASGKSHIQVDSPSGTMTLLKEPNLVIQTADAALEIPVVSPASPSPDFFSSARRGSNALTKTLFSPRGRSRRQSCRGGGLGVDGTVLQRKTASIMTARCSLRFSPISPVAAPVGGRRGAVDERQKQVDRFVQSVLNLSDRFEGRALVIDAEQLTCTWNTARASPMHAQRAAQCALRLAAMQIAAADQDFGIGVTTGPILVGLAGTARQMSAVALGPALVQAQLLAHLCPKLSLPAVTEEATHAAASSVVQMRVVDTVSFGGGARSGNPSLVYQLMDREPDDAGYTAGWAALLSHRYEQAVELFCDHVRNFPADAQARRMVRVASALRDELLCDGYSRTWRGWDQLEAEDWGGETPREVGEYLRQVTQSPKEELKNISVFSAGHARRSMQHPDDVLLRQQIEAARQARAVSAEGPAGVPVEFRDQRDGVWHRSGDMLGKGAFGEVWLGMSADATMVAIKSMRLPKQKADQPAGAGPRARHRKAPAGDGGIPIEELLKEVQLMLQLRHENIVSFLGSAVEGDHILIVMEYCSGGSLQGMLGRFGVLPTKSVQRYTRDMLKGLRFLHDKSIIHRDLKPHNVLVLIEGTAKLADFGASAQLQEVVGDNRGVIGTPLYMAPEAARGAADKPSDIWGLGMVVCMLTTAKLPWPCALDEASFNPHQFLYRLGNEPEFLPELPEELGADARGFVSRCLLPDPSGRPTAQELLTDVFILR